MQPKTISITIYVNKNLLALKNKFLFQEYKINGGNDMKFLELKNMIETLMENEEQFDEQTLKDSKELLLEELKEKSSNINEYLVELKVRIESMKSLEEHYKKSRKTLENQMEIWKNIIKGCMITLGEKKIITDTGSITVKNNPKSVKIIDESLVPEEFKTEEISIKIDKKALKQRIEEGEEFEGITLEQTQSILIK